jgi:outer membrane protein, multidrug efflux system
MGTYAASATQPIFEGGYLRNNLRYGKSQERQAVISYEQTIQRAFGDVSEALIGYEKYHAVRERQEQSVKDLQESVEVSLTVIEAVRLIISRFSIASDHYSTRNSH